MDDQEIRDKLISIGHAIEINGDISNNLINSLKPYSRANLSVWLTVGRIGELTNQELIELLKGLVLLEKKCNWLGGSVASTKYLQQTILFRGIDKDKAIEVFSWVVQNTVNSHAYYMAKDILQSQTRSEDLNQWTCSGGAQSQATDEHLQSIHKKAVAQRKKRKQIRKYMHKRRSTHIRTELINRLDKLSVRDQLILISHDNVYLPNFYPTIYAASANINIIKALPDETKRALILKMKGKFRGPWGRFKKRLILAYGEEDSNGLLDESNTFS